MKGLKNIKFCKEKDLGFRKTIKYLNRKFGEKILRKELQ